VDGEEFLKGTRACIHVNEPTSRQTVIVLIPLFRAQEIDARIRRRFLFVESTKQHRAMPRRYARLGSLKWIASTNSLRKLIWVWSSSVECIREKRTRDDANHESDSSTRLAPVHASFGSSTGCASGCGHSTTCPGRLEVTPADVGAGGSGKKNASTPRSPVASAPASR
jgi:hypothetical protein